MKYSELSDEAKKAAIMDFNVNFKHAFVYSDFLKVANWYNTHVFVTHGFNHVYLDVDWKSHNVVIKGVAYPCYVEKLCHKLGIDYDKYGQNLETVEFDILRHGYVIFHGNISVYIKDTVIFIQNKLSELFKDVIKMAEHELNCIEYNYEQVTYIENMVFGRLNTNFIADGQIRGIEGVRV